MSSSISRRDFAKLAAGTAGALALPEAAIATTNPVVSPAPAPSVGRTFPQGFLWGSATASYQVEGAVHEDGRGTTIWDTFAHTPGKTHNGDTGDVADDYYHRYKQDIALMKDLGLKGCRFSIAWSRIQPTGTGQVNQKGLDFYKRMVDALREAGVEPYCTLYHWDLPQALEDRGGWESKDTVHAFADYAGIIAKNMGDRIHNYFTNNEFNTWVTLGYAIGMHAPGLKLPPGRVAQISHHGVLAHGLAVRAIRANAPKGTRVGLAENANNTVPVIEDRENIEAARRAIREENAAHLSVILDGKYSQFYLDRLGKDAPKFTQEELDIIHSPLDFVGLNCYQPTWVRASDKAIGYEVVPDPKSYPTMFSPWLKIGPEGLYWLPSLVHRVFGVKEIYITENGCSAEDTVAADGHVYDTDRVMFLRNYISQLQRAVADGAPVKGYFLWSLLDNFEWADGYDKRFGITYVDFATQKRIPKLSASFYKATIAQNSVA